MICDDHVTVALDTVTHAVVESDQKSTVACHEFHAHPGTHCGHCGQIDHAVHWFPCGPCDHTFPCIPWNHWNPCGPCGHVAQLIAYDTTMLSLFRRNVPPERYVTQSVTSVPLSVRDVTE